MLLLSSAIRILATERPPMHLYTRKASPASGEPYAVIGASRKVGVNANRPVVCRKGTCRRECCAMLANAAGKSKTYQGMIFFSPFFFLLVDSFLGSVVALSAGFAFGSAVVPLA